LVNGCPTNLGDAGSFDKSGEETTYKETDNDPTSHI
jgi:hypothetical protein